MEQWHHRAAHRDGWRLQLGLTLTLPLPLPLPLPLTLTRPGCEELVSTLERAEAEVRVLAGEVCYLVITPMGGGGAPPGAGGALPSYHPYGRRRCASWLRRCVP